MSDFLARRGPAVLLVMGLLLASLASFHLYQRILHMGSAQVPGAPPRPVPVGAPR